MVDRGGKAVTMVSFGEQSSMTEDLEKGGLPV